MPPRFVFWTIIAGGLPTAFRAADRDELLPTFKRILEKHPDAEMKYFARGRLWNGPEEAKAAAARPRTEPRGNDWRPGGNHRDPRQKFADAKKDRNQRWRRERHERKEQRGATEPGRDTGMRRPPRQKPHGDPLAKRSFKPFKPQGRGIDSRPAGSRQKGARTAGAQKPRPFRRRPEDDEQKERRRRS